MLQRIHVAESCRKVTDKRMYNTKEVPLGRDDQKAIHLHSLESKVISSY